MNPLTDRMQTSENPLKNALSLLRSKNPDDIGNTLYRMNPQFRKFVDMNRGKSVQQIASENGIDLSKVQSMLK